MKREVLKALAEGKVEVSIRQTRDMARSLIPFLDLRDWLAIRLYRDEPDDQVSIEMIEEKLERMLKFHEDCRVRAEGVPKPSEARSKELDAWGTEEIRQQVKTLGTFIGHPGATPAHVVSETVSLIDMLRGRLKAIGNITGPPGIRDTEIVDAVGYTVEAANHAEKDAAEWRQSSETWQKRALAAEARLSGPADTPMPERASFMEWLKRIIETENGGTVSYAPFTGPTEESLDAVRRMLAIEEVFLDGPELPNVMEFEAPGIELRLEGKPDPDSICRLLKLVEAFTADNEAK